MRRRIPIAIGAPNRPRKTRTRPQACQTDTLTAAGDALKAPVILASSERDRKNAHWKMRRATLKSEHEASRLRATEAAIDPATEAVVAARLGRAPRGLRAVAVSDELGMPMVIRVASVVDERPFPTLYWLIDPELCLRIDRAEASGLIARFQAQVDADAALRDAMREDHRRHIAHRESLISTDERILLQGKGQWQALAQRGIGGIADFTRVRCLHTWYAAHLVQPNAIGRLLDQCPKAWGGDMTAP